MSRPFIVVGDPLDHGGRVVSGSGETDIAGKPVARVGDKVVCSKHGSTEIVSGDATVVIDGRPVARHGDKTACGGTLISSQVHVSVGNGAGAVARGSDAAPGAPSAWGMATTPAGAEATAAGHDASAWQAPPPQR